MPRTLEFIVYNKQRFKKDTNNSWIFRLALKIYGFAKTIGTEHLYSCTSF